jgi:hypothetical protein
LKLLDESGNCPLCDTYWPPDKLREYLEKKKDKAQIAKQYQEQVYDLSTKLISRISIIDACNKRVIAAAQLMSLTDESASLSQWQINLSKFSEILSTTSEDYSQLPFDAEKIRELLAPDSLLDSLNFIYKKVKEKYPEATPEQTSWDMLTSLVENLKVLEKVQVDFDNASIASERASVLIREFQLARDKILKKLYDDVRDKFVELYIQLHRTDEGGFHANLEPDGAALNLEVDFYGRGTHPPHALHSEGHQDSMGLCLYLALSEKLTGGFIDLTILDDVVMSVDSDHRRELCHLLAVAFPERQYLITTHDKTWASQLRTENVVVSKGSIEFYNWKVETGPQVNYEADYWEKIKTDLENNDVPSASARLRRA